MENKLGARQEVGSHDCESEEVDDAGESHDAGKEGSPGAVGKENVEVGNVGDGERHPENQEALDGAAERRRSGVEERQEGPHFQHYWRMQNYTSN